MTALPEPEAVLGAAPRWTAQEVAERSGMERSRADQLWGALGFPQPAEGERVFTDLDVEALRAVASLESTGIADWAQMLVMTRLMGRLLARLAEGQVEVLVERLGPAAAAAGAAERVPALERLIGHVWRRHLFASAQRLLARPGAGEAAVAVGFVDLVGWTSRTRELDPEGIAGLLVTFESAVLAEVVGTGGRVVKAIGDEVMWVNDDPVAAARCALALAARLTDPPVRVGLAWGRTVAFGGDHFGPVVNLAARLRAVARPGGVLADRELAGVLERAGGFRLRALHPVHVRGYARLRPTAVSADPAAPAPG